MLRLLTINLIQTCCLDENLKKQWQNSYCQNQNQENCLVIYTSTNNNNNLVPKDRLKSSSLQESPYLGPKKTGRILSCRLASLQDCQEQVKLFPQTPLLNISELLLSTESSDIHPLVSSLFLKNSQPKDNLRIF